LESRSKNRNLGVLTALFFANQGHNEQGLQSCLDSRRGNVYGRFVSRPCLVAALLLGMVLPIGCGPVEYIAQVGGRASSSLAQARREKADELAPYEYTAAGEFLKKAREEAGRSQFQTALEYGKIAEEMADRARALSRERKAGRSWDTPGGDAEIPGKSTSEDPPALASPRKRGNRS
jgi:hypothetical protein